MRILVTGGAGFIGSALIRHLLANTDHSIVNVDKLTYAGNPDSIPFAKESPRYRFEQIDVCDCAAMHKAFAEHDPEAVVHLAAESHVDRSIDGPEVFLRTNVLGTFGALQASLVHWRKLSADRARGFRFLHVSTDEVYGDLDGASIHASEGHRYAPSSPYAASKASSDHLVRAWCRTYSLPAIVTNCSNNYGPYQFPEKLIPHMILSALAGKPLPVYGDGTQIRDWLYVEDHARALLSVLSGGVPGESYNICGGNQVRNIDLVRMLCKQLAELAPTLGGRENLERLIVFTRDRPGHDRRYALDGVKLERELGWRANETIQSGLEKTVRWYLANSGWWQRVLDGSYRLERLGVAEVGK